MAIASLHSLYAVKEANTPTWLGGVINTSINMNPATLGEPSSGSLFPHTQSLVGAAPTATWSTHMLKDHLDTLGGLGEAAIGHKPTAGMTFYAYQHDAGGTRKAASGNHKSHLFVAGCIVIPNGLSVDHQGQAVLTYTCVGVSSDGTTNPVTIVSDDAVTPPPTTFPVLDDDRWTLGKITIGGTVYSSIRGLDIDFGVTAVAEGSDSNIYPTFVSIRTVTPTITLRGVELDWFTAANIPHTGRSFTVADASIFLRKRAAGGTHVADGTAVHIKFTMQGIGTMNAIHDVTGNDPSEVDLQLALYGLASTGDDPNGPCATPNGQHGDRDHVTMAALLHFIAADVTSVGDDERKVRALIADAKLGALYPANRPITFTTGTGPEGTPGVIFADGRTSTASDVRYDADTQTWQRRPGEPVVYVGYIKDKRPTPDELQRDAVLEGHWVELGDGASWLCPVARAFEPDDDGQAPWRIALPQRAGLDAKGNWVQDEIVPECSDLWRDAEKWFESFTGSDGETANLTLEFMYDASLRALSANYRIGKVETVLLGLLDDHRAQHVLNALIDWPTVMEWSKQRDRWTSPRWLTFVRWMEGRHPRYRPTMADLVTLGKGDG